MSPRRIEQVPFEQITVPRQMREYFDPEAHRGMVESIRENGILVPLLLRSVGDRLVLQDGERRLRAGKEAGHRSGPALIEDEELSEAGALQQCLVLDCQREQCTAYERASAIEALMKATCCSAAEAAKKIGLSRSTVTKLLSLLSLGDEIREGIKTGAIPMSAGYELAQIDDPVRQAKLAEKLMRGQLTRDSLAATVKASRGATSKGASGRTRRVTATLSGGRSVTVSGDGLTLDSFIEVLKTLLSSARLARRKNWALSTFCDMLKDSAGQPGD